MASAPIGANVFLTGANRGIGLGLVRELLKVGGLEHLFAGCRYPDTAKELQQLEGQHKALRLVQIDVTDDKSIRKAFAEVQRVLVARGGLNLLINNAGILEKEGVTLQEPLRDVFAHHFDVNTIGAVMTTAAFLPLLRKAAEAGELGRIVNVGAALGCIGQRALPPKRAPHRNVAYGMSKAALHHFSKMLALDEPDITTVAMHPDWVRTDMGGLKAPVSIEESTSAIVKRICTLESKDSGKLFHGDTELLP